VAVSDKDHGRVAMPIAAVLARAVHQALDLALGEIAPLDCQVYDAWGRFLDVDFIGVKRPSSTSSDQVKYIFCTVVKGGATAWSASRSQCRMEAPGRVRGMRGQHEPRGQPHFVLPPNLYMGPPPGRGDFLVSNFHPGPIPGNLA